MKGNQRELLLFPFTSSRLALGSRARHKRKVKASQQHHICCGFYFERQANRADTRTPLMVKRAHRPRRAHPACEGPDTKTQVDAPIRWIVCMCESENEQAVSPGLCVFRSLL